MTNRLDETNVSVATFVSVRCRGEGRKLDCEYRATFRVHASGIYCRSCGDGGGNPIRLLDPATGRSRLVGVMPGDNGGRFAVSPDGKSILYGQHTRGTPDLMMIENFQ